MLQLHGWISKDALMGSVCSAKKDDNRRRYL